MDWMTLLRLSGLLGAGGGGQEPTIATNMPGSPTVLNSQPPDLGMPPVYPGIPPTPAPPPAVDAAMPPVYPGVQPPSQDPFDRIMELYKPTPTPANDELMRMYRDYPQRNHPGAGRQILAALASLGSGGPQATDLVLYAPYYRELQDYMTRMKPLEVAARGEDRIADNERMMLLGAMQRSIQGQRANTYDAVSQARIDKMDAEIARMQAETERKEKEYRLREWVAKHPDHKYFWDVNGRLHSVDPKTDQETILEGIEGLTEERKQELIQNRQLAVEQKRGESAKERSEVGKWTVVNIGGKSYRMNSATGEMIKISDQEVTKPGSTGRSGSGARPMTNLDRIRQMQLNAGIILQKEPKLAPAITYEPTTKIPLIKPGVLSRAEEEVLQRRLLNDVYDDDGNPMTHQNLGNRPASGGTVVPANSNQPQSATAPTSKLPEGVVWMIAPDGKTVGKVSVKEQKRLEGLGYKTIAKPTGAK